MFGKEKQLQVFAVDLGLYFALALRLMARAGVDVDTRKKMGAMVHRQAKALGKIFPPARPVETMIAGDIAVLHERHDTAQAKWMAAEATSQTADMPYMVAASAHRLLLAGDTGGRSPAGCGAHQL
ncbi:MAG: hypothetical protein MK180_06065 [Rhodobacteraceae bacterium]|nr:hypothetical protein [Paracoccaceae bacterium]